MGGVRNLGTEKSTDIERKTNSSTLANRFDPSSTTIHQVVIENHGSPTYHSAIVVGDKW